MPKRFLIPIVLVLLTLGCKEEAEIEPNYDWFEFIGSNPEIPFLPDFTANYFGQFFNRSQEDRIGIVVQGEFPEARYMSFNVYDNEEGSPVSNIVDFQIQPDEGSSNPFIDFSISANRQYTLLIAPDVEYNLNYENELLYSSTLKQIAILLRYYVPEINDFANVPLPDVYCIDLDTGESLDCPQRVDFNLADFDGRLKQIANIIDLTEVLQEGRKIDFYRFSGAGLYPNIDNQYLFSNVKLANDNVIMLKFKVPEYANKLEAIPDSDVRYYSMIIGDRLTYTHQSIYDDEFHVASDGYVYLVIGRTNEEVQLKAEGLNFIEWPETLGNKGLLIYRNLLTNPEYEYTLTQVPDIIDNVLDALLNKESLQASTYIGDYSPSGRIMNKEAFLEDFDGFEVAY